MDKSLFEIIPIPMWLEDLSDLKNLFDQWKADGISDLTDFFIENPSKLNEAIRSIKVIQTNQKIHELLKVNSTEHFAENIDKIIKINTFSQKPIIDSLEKLWHGCRTLSSIQTIYTLDQHKLSLLLNFVIVPSHEGTWSQAIITAENITEYKQEKQNRLFAEGMFRYSPASLWVEDFSRIKIRLDHLRQIGIEDFRTFLDVHPEFIDQCMSDIILIDVNQATLDLFNAPDKETLIQNLDKVFTGEMNRTFREQLIELWNGNIHHKREAINYALDGSVRNVLLQFSVFPGYENDWSLVQIALTDITARKKAEAYLEYLGKHDVLTKIFNRSFYTEEINRLERSIIRPVGCIYLDMNGLKSINDQLGHDVGDGMLRRVGDVLNQAVKLPNTVSRIGGDEFVILMPGATTTTTDTMVSSIHELFHIDNQFYSSLPISIAIGASLSIEHESIEDMVKRADQDMYENKKRYYEEKYMLEKMKSQES